MNRVLYICFALFALFSLARTEAQTIALKERAPRIKKAVWLNGVQPPKSEFTFIEFVHSASIPCRQSAERICKLVESCPNTTFIMVTHQGADEIEEWMAKSITPRIGVVVDDVRIRASFGVNYAPYAVILDHKRRPLWFGNPQRLEQQIVDKLIAGDN